MSSKLEFICSEPVRTTAIDPPFKITSLPQELLEQIFSNLRKHDLQAAVCVSWDISRSVQAAANFNEPHSIKNFIQILIQKLNIKIFPGQRELLVGIAKNITPQEFENLLLLKRYILDVKQQLIDVIKTLDEETANDLKNDVQPPHFLEDIFELVAFEKQIDAATEKQIDAANLIPDEIMRGVALQNISKALIQAGNIDRAIVVATSIPSKIMREVAFQDISKALIQADNIDRAIVVATSIPDEIMRGFALQNIPSLQ